MNQDWYYQNGGTRHGPVTAAVLKQLADSGEIRPDTPVWRQGMAQWAPAKAVKGLFTGSPPSTPAPVPSPEAAPPQEDDLGADTGDWHVFDMAVESAKRYCPSDLPAAISGVAGKAGVYSLYAAAALVLLGGVVAGYAGGNIRPFALSLVLGFLLLACQYVAQRLLGACDVAIRANKSVLSSLAIPNCTFILCAAGTICGTLALWWAAVETGTTNMFLGGVAVLAVGAFAAIIAIQPAGISVHVNPACRVGEEAVGVLTFLLKLLLRCTPIAFTAAVGFATFDAASVVMELFRQSEGPLQLMARITRAIGALFAAASIPLVAYITMLLYYLTLDVISAIVSIPAKLDRLSVAGRLAGDDGKS